MSDDDELVHNHAAFPLSQRQKRSRPSPGRVAPPPPPPPPATAAERPDRTAPLAIVIRGPAGAGKSTVAAVVLGALRAAGRPVCFLEQDLFRNNMCLPVPRIMPRMPPCTTRLERACLSQAGVQRHQLCGRVCVNAAVRPTAARCNPWVDKALNCASRAGRGCAAAALAGGYDVLLEGILNASPSKGGRSHGWHSHLFLAARRNWSLNCTLRSHASEGTARGQVGSTCHCWSGCWTGAVRRPILLHCAAQCAIMAGGGQERAEERDRRDNKRRHGGAPDGRAVWFSP